MKVERAVYILPRGELWFAVSVLTLAALAMAVIGAYSGISHQNFYQTLRLTGKPIMVGGLVTSFVIAIFKARTKETLYPQITLGEHAGYLTENEFICKKTSHPINKMSIGLDFRESVTIEGEVYIIERQKKSVQSVSPQFVSDGRLPTTWEDILQQQELKLVSFAKEVNEGQYTIEEVEGRIIFSRDGEEKVLEPSPDGFYRLKHCSFLFYPKENCRFEAHVGGNKIVLETQKKVPVHDGKGADHQGDRKDTELSNEQTTLGENQNGPDGLPLSSSPSDTVPREHVQEKSVQSESPRFAPNGQISTIVSEILLTQKMKLVSFAKEVNEGQYTIKQNEERIIFSRDGKEKVLELCKEGFYRLQHCPFPFYPKDNGCFEAQAGVHKVVLQTRKKDDTLSTIHTKTNEIRGFLSNFQAGQYEVRVTDEGDFVIFNRHESRRLYCESEWRWRLEGFEEVLFAETPDCFRVIIDNLNLIGVLDLKKRLSEFRPITSDLNSRKIYN